MVHLNAITFHINQVMLLTLQVQIVYAIIYVHAYRGVQGGVFAYLNTKNENMKNFAKNLYWKQ